MEEKQIIESGVQPETPEETVAADERDTTPEASAEKEISTVAVKFNKETKNISLAEAAQLAQKGMKLEKILPEYERIKTLAKSGGKSVTDFIADIEQQVMDSRKNVLMEKCGGNEEIVEQLLKSAGESADKTELQIAELLKECPEIRSANDIPPSVLEEAELKGSNLLYEYLKYEHRQKTLANASVQEQSAAKNASVGSQKKYADDDLSPVSTEFIKGLWE